MQCCHLFFLLDGLLFGWLLLSWKSGEPDSSCSSQSMYLLSDRPMISRLRDSMPVLMRHRYSVSYLLFLFLSVGCGIAILLFFLIVDATNSSKSQFPSVALAPFIALLVAGAVQLIAIAIACYRVARDDTVARVSACLYLPCA
jgi:hypothetical protein